MPAGGDSLEENVFSFILQESFIKYLKAVIILARFYQLIVK